MSQNLCLCGEEIYEETTEWVEPMCYYCFEQVEERNLEFMLSLN